MKVTRRSVLGAGMMGAAGAAFGMPAIKASSSQRGRRAKNIIFMVADGMADQVPAMASQLQMLMDGRPGYWETLMGQDYAVNGLQDTGSLNSIVTDSSAAASTWGSGRRIWNGQVNMFPDGTKLRTLTQILSENKVRCGLVTTTRITHATPSGFSVNCIQRDLEAQIAEMHLESGVDVLMGGGDSMFSASRRSDKKDLYADFEKAGFKVAKDKTALEAWDGRGKFLGIFSSSHLPYTVDRRNNAELDAKVPTLAAMTKKAIAALKDSPNGFLLQVEGGKVDHGGHANDFAAMIYDQIEFEEAVKAAVDFALEDGDTLVIITADHATGGPSLNGAGHEYFDSTAGLLTAANMTASYDVLARDFPNATTPASMQDLIKAKLGIGLTTAQAQGIIDARAGKSQFPLDSFRGGFSSNLAAILGNHSKVQWTSGNHTSEWVLVTAVGPGSEACHGVHKNTSFFDLILAQKGLKHENPTMDFETAKRHYDKLKEKADSEMVAYYSAPDDLGMDHGA